MNENFENVFSPIKIGNIKEIPLTIRMLTRLAGMHMGKSGPGFCPQSRSEGRI